jgi:hypothetical protein
MNNPPKEVCVQTEDADDAPEKKPFVEPELERHDTLPEITAGASDDKKAAAQ